MPIGEDVMGSVVICWWRLRDQLVAWGLLPKPRFYLVRQPLGHCRRRTLAGARTRRFRRVSLARLLRD